MSNYNFLTTYMGYQMKKFKAALAEQGITQPLITVTDLRLAADLKANSNTYTKYFNSDERSGPKFENLLGKNEYFWPTHVSMKIQKYDSASGHVYTGDHEFTYVDENVFSNGAGAEARALRILYQSYIHIKVDGFDIMKPIPCRHLRLNPNRNYQTADASLQATEGQEFGPDYASRGYFEIHNSVMYFGGDAKNQLIISLVDGDTSGIEGDNSGTMKNRVIIDVHGLLYHQQFSTKDGKKVCLVL